jgi:monoamine oxidase
MLSRRDFLKNTTLTAGGILVASGSFSRNFLTHNPKVIIIGAGFAGLAAAYQLKKRKIDFVILEARNRISGRVFSHTIDEAENLVVELGGEWVGASHTKVIALCKEFGLELFNNEMSTHLIYKGEYFKNTEWDFSTEWKIKLGKLFDHYHHLTTAEKITLDKMDWWRYLVNNGCNGRDLDIRELLDSTDFGESIRQVSAFSALSEYAESSAHNEMDFKIRGGNNLLAKKIAERIGYDKIKLEHAVAKIIQKDKVNVYCGNGEKFEGDKIICTIPTFSMQKILWEPVLPKEKIEAVNALQYARINKNIFLFNERFWKDESFDLITDTPVHYFYHGTKNQISAKGALISYSIGDKGDVISKQNDEFRASLLQQCLQPGFPDIKSKILKQLNYYWGEDEYSKGSYAMYGKGQWFGVQPVLKRSFLHTHFAGEHLADWQGFMEGAIETGEAAANKI